MGELQNHFLHSSHIYASVVGTGAYLPVKCLTNEDLSKFLDTSDEWIFSRTGIRKRYIAAEEEATSDLATKALQNALDKAGLSGMDLDGIVVATTTPDLIFPATAIRVQRNIGARACFAFDIQAVCSGFIYGLSVAEGLIISGQASRIAIVGADIMSRIVNWQDRSTCVLFGDGAGAMIIEAREGVEEPYEIGTAAVKNSGRLLGSVLSSKAELEDILKVEGGVSRGNWGAKLSMHGSEVFKHGVVGMCEVTERLLKKINLNVENIDWLVPHQANVRLMNAVAKKIGVQDCKVINTIGEHANTGSATIPLALDRFITMQYVKHGHLIVATAAGGGMTFGSFAFRM